MPCLEQGRIQGGRLGRSPREHTKVTLFTMIFYKSPNSIRYIRPLCRPLFCHSSIVKYSGGLRIGGARQSWKGRPFDDVIILSQPWLELLRICGPRKDTFLRLRHDWHNRNAKRRSWYTNLKTLAVGKTKLATYKS